MRPLHLERCLTEPTPAADLERLRAAHLEPIGPFTDAERCALAEGLASLPDALQRVPGSPLRLRLDAAAASTASGMAEPEWDGDEFLLRPQNGTVTFRDAALAPDARRLLWRARAVVHALLSRHDDLSRWSQSPTWRRTNGWLLPFERPLAVAEFALNQADTAFARPRGKASARLDFLTFAEAALVPVTALATDELLRCQDFTRHRALGQLLGVPWVPEPCPAFDDWVREDELDGVEVLLVQASGRAAESLFGHLLLRPVWRTSQGPTFESAIQFAALTLPRSGPMHLVRGTFGGYSLGVFTISMTDLFREKLSGEQRGLTRWRLALSAAERRRLMERAWEFERRGRFAYAFFSDNCATVLVWMLESSLDEPELARWPGFITAPADILDSLFKARRRTGERLVTAVYPSYESTGAVARRDEARRLELESALGVDWPDVHEPDVTLRREAYRRAEQATRLAPAAQHAALFDWWALSTRVERAQADEALHEQREADEARLLPHAVDLDAIWRERLAHLERESELQKHLMLLDREALADELRRKAEKRPQTESEVADEGSRRARLALYADVTALQSALVAEVLQEGEPLAFLADEQARARAEEVHRVRQSIPVSGHWRTGLGAGVWRRADGLLTPVVQLEEAGLLEWLGEHRLRGLGAATGSRVLEGGLTLAPALGGDPVVASHFTLLGFDSLSPATPPAARWKDHVGFGFELATDFRAWRSVPTVTGAAGWVLLGARADDTRHVLALGVGPVAWVGSDAAGLAPLGGVSGRLLARTTLGAAALRAELRHASVWGPGRAMHELRADVALEWILSWDNRPRVVLRPTLALTAEPARGRVDALGLLVLEPVESLADLVRRGRR